MENYEIRYDYYEENKSNEEYIEWSVELFNKIDKVLAPNGKILYNMSYGNENGECMLLTIGEILRKTNFTIADIIVWEKDNALPNNVSPNKLTRICEFVFVFCRKKEYNTFTANKPISGIRKDNNQVMYRSIINKIKARNNDENCPLNKATYSTDLCYQLMNIYCKEGDIILDPFMGTGTTAVAAYKKQCHYIGFELSPKQCEWANNRLNKIKNQISFWDID